MGIFDEEGFGPSVSLYIAEDDAQAVAMANDSVYGLNGAVFSQNMERALGVAREMDLAQVHINNMTPHDERKCQSF
jgi:acyl-CoA reductase-like NAD-dependent aldehyde dehydrogenase